MNEEHGNKEVERGIIRMGYGSQGEKYMCIEDFRHLLHAVMNSGDLKETGPEAVLEFLDSYLAHALAPADSKGSVFERTYATDRSHEGKESTYDMFMSVRKQRDIDAQADPDSTGA